MPEQVIDVAALNLKEGQRYLLFVDPTQVDLDNLPRIDADVLIIPVLTLGRPMNECVMLVPKGASTEEWMAELNKSQENDNGIPQ